MNCGHAPSFSEGIQQVLAESGGIGLRIFRLLGRCLRGYTLWVVGCPTALDKAGEKGLFGASQIPEAASGCPIVC